MRRTLALLIAGLSGVLGWQWHNWPLPLLPSDAVTSAEAAQPGSEAPVMLPQVQLPSPPDRERYASLLERPLFRPDRKPEPPPDAPPESAAAPEVSADLTALDLTAVVLALPLRSAWVRDPSQASAQRLRLGDELKGWTVQAILEDQVTLTRAGEEYTLILRDYSKPPLPPAAAPAHPSAPVPSKRQLPRPPPRPASPAAADR